MFSGFIANALALAAFVCAIVVAVQSNWVLAQGGSASSGIFHYCGAGASGPCEISLWFSSYKPGSLPTGDINFQGFASSSLKSAGTLWVVAIVLMFVSFFIGLFVTCFNCCCLCCISAPLAILSGLCMFAATGLCFATVILFGKSFGDLLTYTDDGGNPTMLCPGSGSFNLGGQCGMGWAYSLAIGICFMCLVSAFAMTPLCTTLTKKAVKTVV